MVIRRASDESKKAAVEGDGTRYLVAAYLQDGSAAGYLTPRDTLMFWSSNAATFNDRASADAKCARMQSPGSGWGGFLWTVEKVPKRHIDARTGTELPPSSEERRAEMDTMLERALEIDRRFAEQHGRNKPSTATSGSGARAVATPSAVSRAAVDTRAQAALPSVLHADEHEGGDEYEDDEVGAVNTEEGDDSMVLVRKGSKVAKAGGKAGAKGKASKAVKVPKMKLRTATTASKRAAAASNGGGPCLCGCGAAAVRWLLRGHVKVVNSKLAQIKAGTITPEKAFGKAIAAAYGPWTKLRSGGQKPATTNFDKVRANV